MTTVTSLSVEDQEFLDKCEEEFKDRYTEKDEEFIKVHNAEPSTPPIIENFWAPQNNERRNDHRFNRRNHPYDRQNRDHRGSGSGRDHRNDNREHGYRNNRPRFNY